MTDALQETFLAHDFTPDVCGTLTNREFGGLTTGELTQELRDNADDAGASMTQIHLNSVDANSATLHQFSILDNGCGMLYEKMLNAFILSKHHEHAADDTGKFGDGLKNATLALGNSIHLVTKKAGSEAFGIHLDISKMKKANKFTPTSAGSATVYKDIFPDELWTVFSSQTSGTMISVREIKSTHAGDVTKAAVDIAKSLSFANSTTRGNSVTVHSNRLKDSLVVDPVDPFYRKSPGDLDSVVETEILVYTMDENKLGIYERLTSERIRGSGSKKTPKEVVGTVDAPRYFKFTGLMPEGRGKKVSGDEFHRPVTAEVLPVGEPMNLKVRLIKVSEGAYKEEGLPGARLADVANRRRGIWFYRNNRLVGAARTLGLSLDDHYNRIRMEVTFPGDLDTLVGMRTQKQIGEVANDALRNALVLLWKQVSNQWIKKEIVSDDDTATVMSEDAESVAPAPKAPAKAASKAVPKTATKKSPTVATTLPITVVPRTAAPAPEPAVAPSPQPTAAPAAAPAAAPQNHQKFFAAVRPLIKEANPNFSVQEITAEIGHQWTAQKALDAERTQLKAETLAFSQKIAELSTELCDTATIEQITQLRAAMKVISEFHFKV